MGKRYVSDYFGSKIDNLIMLSDEEFPPLTDEDIEELIWLCQSCDEVDQCFNADEIYRCPLCLEPVEGNHIHHKPVEFLIN